MICMHDWETVDYDVVRIGEKQRLYKDRICLKCAKRDESLSRARRIFQLEKTVREERQKRATKLWGNCK